MEILAVGIGGSLGAIARYIVSMWAAGRWGADFPYGTLLVNIVGCFIIGLFMTATTERFIVSPYWRLVVTVGFVGGLTTFSSFSYESLKLLENGSALMMAVNIAANCIIGFSATWLGMAAARALWII